MNLLINQVNNTIINKGVAVTVNPSFRIYIKFDNLVNSEATNEDWGEWLQQAFGVINGDLIKGYSLWASSCREQLNNEEQLTNRLIDFEMDKNVIYADFVREYNIDLYEVDLNTFKFLALLNNLSSNSGLMQRISYRMYKKPGKDKNAHHNAMLKMQKLYAIKQPIVEVESTFDWEYYENKRKEYLKSKEVE